MSKYACTKCGEVINSKCRHQRSVFPENGTVALLSYTVGADVKPAADRFRVEGNPAESFEDITITVMLKREDNTDEDLKQKAINFIVLHQNEIRILLCKHDYKVVSAEPCMFGCCQPESVEVIES